MTSGRLAALSVVVALGVLAAYTLLLRVPLVRNHLEGYAIAFGLATVLAALAVARARARRWPAWLALGFSTPSCSSPAHGFKLRRRAGAGHADGAARG